MWVKLCEVLLQGSADAKCSRGTSFLEREAMKDKGDLRVGRGGMAPGLPFGPFSLLQPTSACHVPWKNLCLLLQSSSSGRQVAIW